MKITIMRRLRLAHGVSLTELASTIHVSPQYLSDIELGNYPATDNAKRLVTAAFSHTIEARRHSADLLEKDFHAQRERLLDFIEISESEADL